MWNKSTIHTSSAVKCCPEVMKQTSRNLAIVITTLSKTRWCAKCDREKLETQTISWENSICKRERNSCRELRSEEKKFVLRWQQLMHENLCSVEFLWQRKISIGICRSERRKIEKLCEIFSSFSLSCVKIVYGWMSDGWQLRCGIEI